MSHNAAQLNGDVELAQFLGDGIRPIPDLAHRHGRDLAELKHDQFPLNGATIMIPRHSEIGEMLARAILSQAANAIDN